MGSGNWMQWALAVVVAGAISTAHAVEPGALEDDGARSGEAAARRGQEPLAFNGANREFAGTAEMEVVEREPETLAVERWAPVTSGPFVTFTAPIPAEGQLTLQPLAFASMVRGGFDADSKLQRLEAGDSQQSLTTQLFLEYGLPRDFSAGGQLTVLHNRVRSGGASANATGLGDLLVFGRYAAVKESTFVPAITTLVQLKAPVGKHDGANPAKLGADLMGTGCWEATAGLNLTKNLKPVVLHLDLLAALPTSAENDGVTSQHGPQFLWSSAAEIPLGWGFGLMFELTGRHQADMSEEGTRVAGSGVTDVLAGAGLAYVARDNLQFLVGYQRSLLGKNTTALDTLGFTIVPTLF